jgi:flagellar basal-body rod modification protein FlgD
MTTTTSTQAQQTLDSLLAKIGAKSATAASAAANTHKTTLDQSDFLKLMTAQMSNQDPFQPQSNTEMIAQMAQFSTVTGIQQLNSTMTNMETDIAQNRIATAATFVGKTVLVPGSTALADSTGGISGAIDLPSSATTLNVTITRADGTVAKTINLGSNPAGLVGFSWDGKDSSGNLIGDSSYSVSATMSAGGSPKAVSADVYAPITAAQIPAASTDPQTFTVGGVGQIKMTDIKAIKY